MRSFVICSVVCQASAASCRTRPGAGIFMRFIHSEWIWSCCPGLLTASYQSMTLGFIYCSASPRMLQCYLFTAVAAGHEAAELAPGAGPEEH